MSPNNAAALPSRWRRGFDMERDAPIGCATRIRVVGLHGKRLPETLAHDALPL
jgi:hypothetical protein